MEVLKGYSKRVRSAVSPNVVNVQAQTYDSKGVAVGAPSNATVENGVASLDLPYAAVVNEGTYSVVFTFVENGTRYENKVPFTVVTPYLNIWELEEILGDDFEGDPWAVESAVRQIINAHTGQTFGKSTKVVSVTGDGTTALYMPERLVELTGVDVNGYAEYRKYNDEGTPYAGLYRFDVTGDGWMLRRPEWLYYNTKADIGTRTSNGAITPPRMDRQVYGRGMKYLVSGTFGYESVPEPVREAMKLLVNDYACSEIAYRDRYLESIKASDWRLQYNTGAYRRTGNVRADHLLAPYVRSKMVII